MFLETYKNRSKPKFNNSYFSDIDCLPKEYNHICVLSYTSKDYCTCKKDDDDCDLSCAPYGFDINVEDAVLQIIIMLSRVYSLEDINFKFEICDEIDEARIYFQELDPVVYLKMHWHSDEIFKKICNN